MANAESDSLPLDDAGARLSELAEEVRKGAEKVLLKNGAPCIAMLDATKLAYYHELEIQDRARGLANDAAIGLKDTLAEKTQSQGEFRKSWLKEPKK